MSTVKQSRKLALENHKYKKTHSHMCTGAHAHITHKRAKIIRVLM